MMTMFNIYKHRRLSDIASVMEFITSLSVKKYDDKVRRTIVLVLQNKCFLSVDLKVYMWRRYDYTGQ